MEGKLNCEGNYNENSCGALTAVVKLTPGEKKELAFLVGVKNDDEAAEITARYDKDCQQICKKSWKN